MASNNAEIKCQAYWCLGNIVGDEGDGDFKRMASEMGIITMLENELNTSHTVTEMRTYVWVAKNFCVEPCNLSYDQVCKIVNFYVVNIPCQH